MKHNNITKVLALILSIITLASIVCGCTSTSSSPETEPTEKRPSKGLEISVGENACFVFGIGDCKDSDILIPSEYEGLPVTTIADHAFNSCWGMTSITIPESVTFIGYRAFLNCNGLKSATLPNSITSIEMETFENCISLTTITIPNSITTIGDYAFRNCSSLQKIQFLGTMEEWNAITKGDQWDGLTGAYTVHCTDGNIAKSAS